jgi:cell wall-associated NlpC family hydrolase
MKKSTLLISLWLSFVINSFAAEQARTNVQEQRRNLSFSSDVIGVKEAQLSASYWLEKAAKKSKLLMTEVEIEQQNQQLINNNLYINEPLALANNISKQALINLIEQISTIPSNARFYRDGRKLTKQNYQKYLNNLNIKAITTINQVQFGLVTKRSSLRRFPTFDKVYSKGLDHDLDRFQESAVFTGDTVAVLHHSADGQWLLVQSYNYLAWMRKTEVAIGEKAQIQAYKSAKNFLVVTGSKVFTNYVPQQPQISNLQLDMGIRLPLANISDYGNSLYGQNPYVNYVVKLPTRTLSGKLKIVLVPIPRSQDVHKGYLAFTPANLIKQSFKFLGERYGWGHDYNGRDCTGFVGEVYKSFGFKMPRNSAQQGNSRYGINQRFTKNTSHKEKMSIINKVAVGDLIYIPGHVMLVLGDEKGKPYVIHDVKGLAYLKENGELYRGTLNGVAVTPLIPLYLSKSTSYVDEIYNIKRIGINSSFKLSK